MRTLNPDRPQMDVTSALQPRRDPAGVVTRMYNRRRPYIRLPKWTKVPGQQKMVTKPRASLEEASQHALQ